MNLHGYKKKKKTITRLIWKELEKEKMWQSQGKLDRLERAKRNITKQINKLKEMKK